MAKIKPKSILPYTGTEQEYNSNQNTINISNALSADPPEKMQTKKDVFGLVTSKAAIRSTFTNPTAGYHLAIVRNSWKNRKTP